MINKDFSRQTWQEREICFPAGLRIFSGKWLWPPCSLSAWVEGAAAGGAAVALSTKAEHTLIQNGMNCTVFLPWIFWCLLYRQWACTITRETRWKATIWWSCNETARRTSSGLSGPPPSCTYGNPHYRSASSRCICGKWTVVSIRISRLFFHLMHNTPPFLL